MKTREINALPSIHQWEEYMSVESVERFPSVSIYCFLSSYDLGKDLAAGKTSESREFRVKCKEFLDQLIVMVLQHGSVTSGVSRGLSSFCSEILFEGDNTCVFTLFADLCRLYVGCGVLPLDVSKAAVEEFASYVAEKRRQHVDSTRSASDIANIMEFLLNDFAFQARHRVFRVFKLCCLVIELPRSDLPAVEFDLSGSALSRMDFDRSLRLVQSYVLSSGYSHKAFFTNPTLDAVRDAIATSGVFFVAPNYNLWAGVCDPAYEKYIADVGVAYKQFLDGRRKAGESHYVECNRANRLSQVDRGSCSSREGSLVSSGSKTQKGETLPVSIAKKVSPTTSKSSGKGNVQKGKNKTKSDPSVFHKIN